MSESKNHHTDEHRLLLEKFILRKFANFDSWEGLPIEILEELAYLDDHIFKQRLYECLASKLVIGLTSEPIGLEVDIRALDLTTRIFNALRNARIDTVGDLLRTPVSELCKLPNFGKTSLNELEKILTRKGRSLGELA